jgi:hypothetical protein
MKKDGQTGSNEPAKYQPAPPEGKGFRAGPARLVEICRGGGDDRATGMNLKEARDGRP